MESFPGRQDQLTLAKRQKILSKEDEGTKKKKKKGSK